MPKISPFKKAINRKLAVKCYEYYKKGLSLRDVALIMNQKNPELNLQHAKVWRLIKNKVEGYKKRTKNNEDVDNFS